MYGAGAAFFCLEPEPTQIGRSRNRFQDLGRPEPEPPKKWRLLSTGFPKLYAVKFVQCLYSTMLALFYKLIQYELLCGISCGEFITELLVSLHKL